MHYRTAETEAHRFLALAGGIREWWHLDQWLDYMVDASFFSDDLLNGTEFDQRQVVHQLLRQLHDAALWPRFACLPRETEGERVEFFKPMDRLTLDDYGDLVQFHANQPGPLHRKRAAGYAERAGAGSVWT